MIVLGASSISVVLDVYQPERAVLLELLGGLQRSDWERPTECPAYTIKGVTTHILGDDFSLLSRQRDAAQDGLSMLRAEFPDADFRTLLDSFNDRWVTASRFFSTDVLIELLRLTGEWTASYYRSVDPTSPGESVGFFGANQGEHSPFWQAIAREYMERWIHHSQIRRALGRSSLAAREYLVPGVEVAAAVARVEPGIPSGPDGAWALGPIILGAAPQAAGILTRAYSAEEVQGLLSGPAELVQMFAAVTGRP